ncbi:hypothetical protein LK07_24240 [Streptomyces pluripotens]|uniref:Uncharacterized protein n=1 Tax=Streptomyces pluripotens TaxID=1355015 RepID=A0A221P386_9ACTN|nr:hypothetical protein LK06_023075 [Streptomyces pluripotens]ASN26604.1 hypothetical protein LK07_24240 [Streptomyces pluripotens]
MDQGRSGTEVAQGGAPDEISGILLSLSTGRGGISRPANLSRVAAVGVQPLQHLADRDRLALSQSLSVLAFDDDILHNHSQAVG